MANLFLLEPDAVATLRVTDKGQVLGALADRFAAVYGLDRGEVLERIEERERLGSTGFGRGVASPHARIAGVTEPVAAFLRLEIPVAFEAADGMPVGLVFGLLSPDQGGASHLQALAAISRTMRDERMRSKLETAPDAEAIFGLLSNVIDRDAA